MAFHYVHFRNLLPLSSVDIFIQAIIIRILGFTELYCGAGRDISALEMDWPHKTYSVVKAENTQLNQQDRTTWRAPGDTGGGSRV